MNFSRVIAAFALCVISYVIASPVPLTISSGPSSPQVVGVAFSVLVEPDGTFYNAFFSDSFGNTFNATNLPTNSSESITPVGLFGPVTWYAQAVSPAFLDSAPATFTMNLPSLSINSFADLIYGQAVPLVVTTNGASNVQYTASFSCTSGSYQVTGLTTGIQYNIVPGGVYGEVVVTVTATNANPATLAFTLFKPSNNIPAHFENAHQRYYPSIYANMKEGKELEVIEIKNLESLLH